MEKNYLIINTGSASKKYALYRGGERIFFAHFETEDKKFVATFELSGKTDKRTVSGKEFSGSLAYTLNELSGAAVLSEPKREISGIGFRVVAPGVYFQTHRLIDDEFLKKMKTETPEAPLHITPMIDELAEARRLLADIPIVGVSDSAFHSTIPERAYTYAIPHGAAEKFGIRKFGYHGSSFASVVEKIKKMPGGLPTRLIVCHLGSGSSITAISNGKSIDTSMGLTPLEGVPMGTRVGDIDPGAVIRLAEKLKYSPEDLERYFYHESGMLGVSGKSNDTRELIALEKEGDAHSKLALDVFAYRVQKCIGSYVAALNGLDMLVFSGTIGERSFVMRSRICGNLNALGIVLDEEKNNGLESQDTFIHKEGSPVKIALVTTDEMLEIAGQTAEALG